MHQLVEREPLHIETSVATGDFFGSASRCPMSTT
jgi:hypothetical protein